MPSLNVTLMRAVARTSFTAAVLPAGTYREPYHHYMDAIASALCQAIDIWRIAAQIADVKIIGTNAFFGKLTGPGLDGLIRGFAPAGAWDAYSRAIAAGVHNQFRLMCGAANFPGLQLYPAFAAYPAPFAPPTPNVPVPLMTFVLSGLPHVDVSAVRAEIVRKLPTPKPPCADAVAMAVADAFCRGMQQWLASTQIVGLMGTGPIPTFAPPVCPVGPVLNGWVVARPGLLAG